MNLIEYRAMVAQEAEQKNSTPQIEEQSNVQAEQSSTGTVEVTNTETNQTQQTSTPPVTETKVEQPTLPETIEINGKQVPLDELKSGYLRQSDYTQKTQALAQEKRQLEEAIRIMEQVKQNPEVAKTLNYDEREARLRELEANYNDLLLAQEINTLSSKYADFDADSVLQFAVDKQMVNLEDAYLLYKSTSVSTPNEPSTAPVDMEAIKAQIRAELKAEMEAEQNTSSIISTNQGTPPTSDNAPQLSPEEVRIAQAFRMSPEEYAKWR